MNEIRNIIQDTLGKYSEEFGFSIHREEKVKCIAQFYDKINKETKIIIINRFNIVAELNRIMQKSRGLVKLVGVIELTVVIEGRINKNIMNMYFKSGCMPVLWKKFYGRNKNKNRNAKHYCHFNKR